MQKKIKIRMNLPCLLGKGNNYYTIRTIFPKNIVHFHPKNTYNITCQQIK